MYQLMVNNSKEKIFKRGHSPNHIQADLDVFTRKCEKHHVAPHYLDKTPIRIFNEETQQGETFRYSDVQMDGDDNSSWFHNENKTIFLSVKPKIKFHEQI